MLYWLALVLVPFRGKPFLNLAYLIGVLLTGFSVWQLADHPWLAIRLLLFHLTALMAVYWGADCRFGSLGTLLLLVVGPWYSAHCFGQDSLSGWLPIGFAVATFGFLRRGRNGTVWLLVASGWLGQWLIEDQLTPSWLRPQPYIAQGFFFASPAFPPPLLWMAATAALLAVVSRRSSSSWWTLALAFSLLAPGGSVYSSWDLCRLVPSEFRRNWRIDMARLPELDVEVTSEGPLQWLFYSNNPENIRSLRSPGLVLIRETVPEGSGRVFLSHFNTTGRALEFVLEVSNPEPRAVVIKRLVSKNWLFPELGSWQGPKLLGSGERVDLLPKQSFSSSLGLRLGNAQNIEDLHCDGPLQLALAVRESGGPDVEDLALAPMVGGQSRGLFPLPQRTLTTSLATVQGPATLTLENKSNWLRSAEGQELVGNYGVSTRVQVRLTHREFSSCSIFLVPCGGWAGVLHQGVRHSLPAFSGLLLYQGPMRGEFHYDHHLTINSYAPIRLLFIPRP